MIPRFANDLALRLTCFFVLGLSLLLANITSLAQAPSTHLVNDTQIKSTKQHLWHEMLDATAFPAVSQPIIRAAMQTDIGDWWLTTYQAIRNDQWELFSYRRGGGIAPEDRQLTKNNTNDTQAHLNSDATQIVFVSDRDGNRELYRMDADGGNQKRLTDHPAVDRSPDWSGDSKKIVFVSDRDGNAELYVMDSNGGNVTRLTNDAQGDFQPSWSPDGSKITWIRTVSERAGAIWVMNADGSNAHAITGGLQFVGNPIWSPDGTQIAFDYDADNDGLNRIALINADGSGLNNIDTEPGYPTSLTDHLIGAWFPDGKGLYQSWIRYEIVNGQVRMQDILINVACFQSCPGLVVSSGTFLPDIQNSDPYPPESKMEPLSPYVRFQQPTLFISAQDRGPSDLALLFIESRPEGSSQWNYLFTVEGETENSVGVGRSFDKMGPGVNYFRSQVFDRAGNEEAWPASEKGDTSTTFFSYLLKGRLQDARGVPIPNTAVSSEQPTITELKTDLQGAFLGRYKEGGAQTINQGTFLRLEGDLYQELYRVPTHSLIQNGGFEYTNLASWSITGMLPARQQMSTTLAGFSAAALGYACSDLCISTPPFTLRSRRAAQVYTPILVGGREGDLHVVGAYSQSGIYYRHRTRNGEWEPAISMNSEGRIQNIHAVVDAAGNFHVVLESSLEGNAPIYYLRRSRAGIWSAPQVVAQGGQATLAVESNGQVHLVYAFYPPPSNNNGPPYPVELHHQTLPVNGAWSEAKVVIDSQRYQGALPPYLAIGPDDRLHLFWTHGRRFMSGYEVYETLYETIYTPGLGWREIQRIAGISQFIDHLDAVVDSSNTIHLIYVGESTIFYYTKKGQARWSELSILLTNILVSKAKLLLDKKDTLYLVTANSDTPNSNAFFSTLRMKRLGGEWSHPQSLAQSYGLYGSEDDFALIDQNLFARTPAAADPSSPIDVSEIATEQASSAIQQTVTIPPTLHKPTLAFMYQLEGGTTGQSYFYASVSNGISETQLFSTTQNTAWHLGWADLSSWVSQTVTITLGVQQAISDTYLRAYVDEISIGAWETPVASAFVPARIEAGVGGSVIISGENFIATPSVKLGDTPLTAVQWKDETTLQATLPNTLAPGLYDLWVSNPGGQTSVRLSAVAIGKQTYLPVAAR